MAEERGIVAERLRCEYLADPVGIDCRRPRLSWELRCPDPGRRGARQTAYRIQVRHRTGRLAWDSGTVASDQAAHVEYAGTALEPCGAYEWRVRVWDEEGRASRWSGPSRWTMGPGESGPRGWRSWKWIGLPLAATWDEHRAGPSPLVRKTFTVGRPVSRAVLFASALGLYEAHLNGRRVGDAELAPEWTDYRTRVQCRGTDVTALVRSGENVIGAILGPGWYAGRIGPARYIQGIVRGIYGRALRFAALLVLSYADGEEEVVLTDPTWRCSDEGPILGSDLLDGELYDARRELPGWDAPGYDDSRWTPVSVSRGPMVVCQPNEPIRVTQDLAAVSVSEPQPGVFVFDLGQNMVGRVRLRLRGRAGDEVRLRHAETLNPDGTLCRDSLGLDAEQPLRGARQEDRYICRSDAEEVFEPRFTSHGFRYVEVTGLQAAPRQDDLAGRVLHSDAPEAGTFECSRPEFNRIMAAIQWTQRGNLQGVPTDCQQRDERLGWAGDIQVFCRTAMFNRDMAAFLGKWLVDVWDAQTPDGRFPDFAPHPFFGPLAGYSGNPGWADAGVIIPWQLYVAYGDRRILEQAFAPACRWVDYGERENPDLVWRDHGKLSPLYYGDWLNADTFVDVPKLPRTGAEVPRDVFATAFFARSAELVARMAEVLDRPAEALRYRGLSRRIKAAFVRKFVKDDGTIRGGTQAGAALALHFDLLPIALRRKAAQRMVAALRRYRGALSTGIQSTLPMMRELVRWGYPQEAYRLLDRPSVPSWRSMIEHGGTTIWERWDGWVEGRGPQKSLMNSFNHYAFGSVGEWMWRVIAGINPDEEAPGGARLTIAPIPGAGVTWVRAIHHTIRGLVDVEWRQEKARFTLEVSLPPNMKAVVVLPDATPGTTTESGCRLVLARGVRILGRKAGDLRVGIGAGRYRFSVDR